MRQYKNKIKAICGYIFFTGFIAGLVLPSFGSGPVVEGIEYLYLSRGLEFDHKLPEAFKKEKRLKFEGNYKRYTSAVYNKSDNSIRFKPKRIGSALMIIKNSKNKIIRRLSLNIQKDDLHTIAAELRDLLIAIDGIEVKIYNKKVIIDGQVLLPREMDRIKDVIKQYNPRLVQSLVRFSPEAQKKIAEIIEEAIGYPEVTVRYAYNRFLLEGCVSSQEEKERAFSRANLYTQFEVSPTGDNNKRKGVAVVKNDIITPCESEKKEKEKEQSIRKAGKLIQIVAHFVEMEKSFNKGFLFQWSPAIGDNGTQITVGGGSSPQAPRGITAALTATIGNFFPKLNWAKSFDFARVLHNSSLLVEERARGVISVDTSIAQTTAEGESAPSTMAKVSTAVTPTIIGERGNLIHMSVQIVVASPAAGGGAVNRQIDTVIHVRDGSSAVIGGIISSVFSRSYNKSPYHVENAQPILNLLSQKGYNTKKSQFVIFITPLIKSSASIGVERIKQKFRLDE